MEKRTGYKWCIVPNCNNTSIQTPDKVFLTVPTVEKVRIIWMKAVRRDPKDIALKTVCFVCEDHFDVSNLCCDYYLIVIYLSTYSSNMTWKTM